MDCKTGVQIRFGGIIRIFAQEMKMIILPALTICSIIRLNTNTPAT